MPDFKGRFVPGFTYCPSDFSKSENLEKPYVSGLPYGKTIDECILWDQNLKKLTILAGVTIRGFGEIITTTSDVEYQFNFGSTTTHLIASIKIDRLQTNPVIEFAQFDSANLYTENYNILNTGELTYIPIGIYNQQKEIFTRNIFLKNEIVKMRLNLGVGDTNFEQFRFMPLSPGTLNFSIYTQKVIYLILRYLNFNTDFIPNNAVDSGANHINLFNPTDPNPLNNFTATINIKEFDMMSCNFLLNQGGGNNHSKLINLGYENFGEKIVNTARSFEFFGNATGSTNLGEINVLFDQSEIYGFFYY